jgi:Resolvase, N terminal domain
MGDRVCGSAAQSAYARAPHKAHFVSQASQPNESLNRVDFLISRRHGGTVSNQTRQTGAGTMSLIGYARVSTTDQDLSIQEAALKAVGCQVIRAEKRSGTTTEGREALRTVLEFLYAGDVLTVSRIDRLARSIGDLQDIVRTVRARGAVLKATEQPIDTGTAAGKCFLDMLVARVIRIEGTVSSA